MLARPDVQALLKRAHDVKEQAIANVRGQITVIDQETERLTQTISISEIQLISEYVNNAMLDHLSYYRGGKPIPLEDLSPEQRRQIKRIVWDTADPEGNRKVLDYVLEERAEARSQLAKITGIVNPAFDFAGLLALMTGKKKEDAQEEIRRLNHSEGVNWESIQKKAGVLIEGECKEVGA